MTRNYIRSKVFHIIIAKRNFSLNISGTFAKYCIIILVYDYTQNFLIIIFLKQKSFNICMNKIYFIYLLIIIFETL